MGTRTLEDLQKLMISMMVEEILEKDSGRLFPER